MISEPFATGESQIHVLDPRLRIVIALLYSVCIAVASQFSVLIVAMLLAIVLILLARLTLSTVLYRIAVVNVFIAFLWLLLPITFDGRTLYAIGPIAISYEGVRLAAQITLKSNSIVLVLMALMATMPIATLGHALEHLRVPSKIVHLLLMTYRYIFVIELEYTKLRSALKIRGFQPKTTLHTYKTYAYLIGMLFVRAAARAERVHRAMMCRGFKGKFYCLQRFPTSRYNTVFAISMAIVIGGLAGLEWLY
jgi:cobalt/nickel transport system permease protein